MSRSPRPRSIAESLAQGALSPAQVARLRQVRAALADRDGLYTGWRPGLAELADAPTLYAWEWGRHRFMGLPALLAQRAPEVRLHDYLTTSPLVALSFDGERGWARTWSRFYRLDCRAQEYTDDGVPLPQGSRAEFFTSDVQFEPIWRSFELRYTAPAPHLEPERDLGEGDDAAWARLRTWAQELYGDDADDALAVHLALRHGCSTQRARALLTTPANPEHK